MTKEPMIQEYFFQNKEALFAELGKLSIQVLEQALKERPQASLLVSGGGTPAPLFTALSSASLDWERVSVALVDERWVDIDHPASNAALVEKTLLRDKASAARFVGMKNKSETAQSGCAESNKLYSALPAPYDLLILGMGPDGHIASLFPHAAGLKEALNPGNQDICCAIEAEQSEVTGENTERLSLTLNGILQTRKIILLITGEDKRKVYRKGLTNKDIESLPVSAVLQQSRTPVDIYWAP